MNDSFFESYRQEFPVTRDHIYLDHSGVAPLSVRVKKAIDAFLTEAVDGAAFHYPKWAQQVQDTRRACARLINAEAEEIAFVRSTSHGLSIVAEGLSWNPGDNVITFEKEFPSNIYPWLNVKRKGVEVKFIPSRDGRIEIQDIEQLIDSKTRLLSISSVQFTNGFRADLARIGKLCAQRNILFCVDAIQSLGLLPMDVRKWNIDFLSADAHKWLVGPEGIGIFYCKKGLAQQLQPPLVGWKCVEDEFSFEKMDFTLKSNALRFEEGSVNLMGVFGLGAAVDLLLEVGIDKIGDRVLNLGDHIIREAEKRGFAVHTPKESTSRGGNITFSGNFDPAIVKYNLLAYRVMVNVRGGGLRVSPHFYNSFDDLNCFFSTLDKLI